MGFYHKASVSKRKKGEHLKKGIGNGGRAVLIAAAALFAVELVVGVKFGRTKALLSHRNTMNNSIEIGVLAPWNSKPLSNQKKNENSTLASGQLPRIELSTNASNKLLMDTAEGRKLCSLREKIEKRKQCKQNDRKKKAKLHSWLYCVAILRVTVLIVSEN